MNNPKLSIIVPVYNAEKYIDRCLNSICQQTYTGETEIILVNDGSADDSLNILHNWAERFCKIVVLDKPGGGAASARNVGIRAARGEYLGFVDADDCIHPDTYKIAIEMIEADPELDIVQFSMLTYSEGETVVHGKLPESRNVVYRNGLEALKVFNRYGSVCIPTKVYRASLFKGFEFPEGIMYEDEAGLPKLFYSARKIAYISDKLYYYFVHDNSVMTAPFSNKNMDAITAFEMRIKFFNENHLSELLPMDYCRYYGMLRRLYVESYTTPGYTSQHRIVKQTIKRWKRHFCSVDTIGIVHKIVLRCNALWVYIVLNALRKKKF